MIGYTYLTGKRKRKKKRKLDDFYCFLGEGMGNGNFHALCGVL
jgi:hypothetical protein